MAIPWGAIISGGASLASAFLGKKKKKKGSQDPVTFREEYRGLRPPANYMEVFQRDPFIEPLRQYPGQIAERSRGEGLVGFDPTHRQILRSEFLKDFGDYESDVYAKASGQASGQGLRGGIPLSIRQDYQKGLGRARESALADIDIRDLEARREDINRATYAQPDLISGSADIQNRRSQFDLSEFFGQTVPYEEAPRTGFLENIAPTVGRLGGILQGGQTLQTGGNDIGSLAKAFLEQLTRQKMRY